MQPAALSPVGFFGLVGRISRSHIQEQGHPSIAFFHLESHVKIIPESLEMELEALELRLSFFQSL